jgi:raffinose/stachyose/melibiose transport system substrate-binding protein
MEEKMKLKFFIFACISFLIASGLYAADAKKITLKMALFANNDYQYFTETKPLAEAYKKTNPNVTIELEKFKDTEDYENAMKIRSSANELPDIMTLKPYMLVNFKDLLLSLNDLNASKNNLYAEKYAVEGKVYGIPTTTINEFVYYKKSVFKELNLSIPKTWDEFVNLAKTIKANGKYIPIALGAKDVWPDYPFNEFMPCLEANDGAYWNAMAKLDEPFAKDKPFYKAYAKIKKLYDTAPFGSSPLGISFDQSTQMFVAGKAAMIAAGQWFVVGNYVAAGGDMNDLGIFYLPVRNTLKDPFIATAMADGFYGIPKTSKYAEESKKFMEWFFTVYYTEFVNAMKTYPTMKGVTLNDPFWKQAVDALGKEKISYVVYDGGGINFTKIKDLIAFDVKRIGQDMLTGADLDKMMTDLNKKWKEARNKK